MKKLMFVVVAGVMSWCAVEVSAQRTEMSVSQEQTDEKVKVKVEDLPEAIKTTLAGDSYKDWTASSALHNKTKDIYEVEVKKGAEVKTLKFTKDGDVID